MNFFSQLLLSRINNILPVPSLLLTGTSKVSTGFPKNVPVFSWLKEKSQVLSNDKEEKLIKIYKFDQHCVNTLYCELLVYSAKLNATLTTIFLLFNFTVTLHKNHNIYDFDLPHWDKYVEYV